MSNKVRFMMAWSPELRDEVQALAEQSDVSAGAYVRMVLSQHIRNRKITERVLADGIRTLDKIAERDPDLVRELLEGGDKVE